MIELIGLIGVIAFGISCIPFAIVTAKNGKTDMPLMGILAIVIGSALMLAYELLTSVDLLRLTNFGITGLCWGVVLFYKLNPRVDRAVPGAFDQEYRTCVALLIKLGFSVAEAKEWMLTDQWLLFDTSPVERILSGEGKEIIKFLRDRAGESEEMVKAIDAFLNNEIFGNEEKK